LIEEKRNIQFILSGSSSRKLRRGGVNLLVGRALWKNFYPFVGHQLGDQFNLKRALHYGNDSPYLEFNFTGRKATGHVDLYLREEVKAEALVRQIGDFSQFLEAIAFSHASVLNLTNVSRECSVPRKTLDLHLQILIELLLGYTLPVFEKRAKRGVTAHPKFYFFDPGVFRVLRKQGFLDETTEIEGAALEGLVAEHLRCWMGFQKEKYELYFWHATAGLEVDFIVFWIRGL
jgi:predicted AAA+ superfamily ATPase